MEREFKDSGIEWIGRIPKEWKISAIKHLMTLYAGATPKSDKDELWDGSIPWVTPADYKTEDVYVSLGRRNISVAGLSSCATTLLPIDSIIFSKRAPIGLVVLNNVPLCTNQGCIGCVPYKNKANSKYYYYVLSVFTEQFELYGSGTTFKEISANNFANFIVSVPPLPEQQRIADYLDKKCGEIDELIALQEQMIAQLTDYKQSVITEAVTKGLNPDAELVPSGIDWIGDVPKGWITIKMKNLVNFIESGVSVNAGNKPASKDELGVLKTSAVSKFVFLPNENKTVNENEKVNVACPVKKNTIIVSRMNTPELVGACGYVDRDYNNLFLPDRLWQVHFYNKTDVKYLWFTLRSSYIRNYYSSLSVGTSSSMQNISQDQFANAIIVLPPLSEQQSIATYLDTKCSEIDSLIAIKQQKIETLKDYKKSVIYEAVTGKMTV